MSEQMTIFDLFEETPKIKEILEENKHSGESLSNITDVYTIAARCLFDTVPMNVISSDYRQRLITGFALNFMYDRIGCHDVDDFKMGLTDKVYNNAEYINAIFANLDKQILADYNTKTANNTLHNTIVDETTIADTGTAATAKTGDDTLKLTGTLTNAKTGTEEVERTGTSETARDGDDTVKNSGSLTSTKAGTDTLTQTGTVTDSQTGTDTTTYSGSEADAHTGTITDDGDSTSTLTKSGSESTANTGHDKKITDGGYTDREAGYDTKTTTDTRATKNNAGQVYLDTPMNNLMNLRSKNNAAYDATGKGITAMSEADYNYLTNASFNDSTSQNSGTLTEVSQKGFNAEIPNLSTREYNGPEDTDLGYEGLTEVTALGTTSTTSFTNREDETVGTNDNVRTFADTSTKTFTNRADEIEHDTLSTETHDRSDVTEYDTTNTETDTRNFKTEYNSTTTVTNDLVDTTTHNTTDTQTDNRQNRQEYNSTSTLTNNLLRTTNKDATIDNEHEIDEVSTNLNLEMIYRSMPLLKKVWELFDELFMRIY